MKREMKNPTAWIGKKVDPNKWIIPEGYDRCAMTGKFYPHFVLEATFQHTRFDAQFLKDNGIYVEDAEWLSSEGYEMIESKLDELGYLDAYYDACFDNTTVNTGETREEAPYVSSMPRKGEYATREQAVKALGDVDAYCPDKITRSWDRMGIETVDQFINLYNGRAEYGELTYSDLYSDMLDLMIEIAEETGEEDNDYRGDLAEEYFHDRDYFRNFWNWKN